MSEVTMSEVPESFRDLLDSQVATLATIGPDERPQLTAVWFLGDASALRLSLNTARQKVKNLRRNPACTLFILDLANPYRYLEVRGDAEISPDDDYAFADVVGAKYGADLRKIDRPGEVRVVVTVRPAKINAVNMRG
ncbi:MAG: PPOX class F420-dependent oxidoreductase [Micromonosporaceae bacterium]